MNAEAETGPAGLSVALAGRLGAFALDIAFAAPATGVTALFGPSGSGKTSVLRGVAGLAAFDGRITVGDEIWQDAASFRPPHRRAVGYVFQEASLFAHLTVAKNLVYGARRSPGGVDAAHHAEIVELLGLGPLLARAPAGLSGGERQRVALGRAILSRPKLLLMDEPLSALDRFAKDEILPYFEALQAELAIPVLYVSHDIAEVERLADRIVVIEKGRVQAAGGLNAALTDSGLGFVRDPHAAAVLPARVVAYHTEDALTELDLGGQPVFVDGSGPHDVGAARRLRIEARDVSLSREIPTLSTISNTLKVRILAIEPASAADYSVFLALEGAEQLSFVAKVTRRSARRLSLAPGDSVFAQIKSVSLATARAIGD
ncbi:putative ATP-binding protein, ABC-type molybdate transporter [Aurantimonas manganoxydans SI85-9A1]|uniref:Putative ATP-binding protein, ABC-type molybdate transporter n=2 Tax=Aurantimonas manganoxydans TaxID=651183 RepID=Q1YHG6_AURMS|nr:molybdenum ABC transporter ATP-binding protein [Aurantimonas manganoxydans]EAS49613.1 putative ATP-binding protein, ABC-type molybdate transporter [Aurantimonas manganoxydans SI85-9A1]BAT29199.1 putative ATP-binding protein, ABC-type molybdate transporter [Aurantimonas manganoxydans SI85-9A1]